MAVSKRQQSAHFLRFLFSPHLRYDPEAWQKAAADSKPGQMVFPLAPGELPNVLQFLATGARTGELDLEFHRADKRGRVFMRDGKVYFAAYEAARGVDALAQMTVAGDGASRFTADQGVDEVNVEIPTSHLLLQIVVMADEQGHLPDDGQTGPAHPAARVPLRTRIRRYLPLLPVLALKLLLVSGVAATIGACGWLLYARIQQRVLVEELTRYRMEANVRRLRAGREQRNEQTTVARALALLGPAKYEAEAKAADIAKVEGGQGLDERRREVGRLMAEAGKALEAGDMDQALPRFRTVSRACDAFMALAVARDKAVAQKTAATAARAKAATEGADVRAKGKWAQAEGLNTQATTLSAAGSYSEAEPLWKGAAEAYAVAAAAGTAARGYSDLAALLERETSAWDPGLRKRLGGSAWSDVQRAREEALALAAREEYAAALVRLEAAQASWARCAAALASERDREIFTQAMARGNDQLAREHWREAEAQFTVALQSPAFKANPEARAGLVKAQTGRLLATACAARDSGAWRDVQDLARKALALTADSDLARLLAAQAKENLIPRLTVQAHYQGGSVTVARVSMNGNPVAETLPATVVLEPGRDYTLRVEAPIQADGAALHTAESQFRAHDAGRRDLDIALEPITAPEPGRVWAVPGTDLALMPIPAGSFRMGSEKGRKDEVPAHKVRLSKPFWCGRSEVTNRQYRDFLADSKYDGAGDALVYLLHFSGSSEMSKDDKAPVCYVSWSNAVAFGEWLSAREQRGGRLPKGYVYRLPTEAEWEYVARAGEENDYTDDPRLMAWYAGNATQNQVVMTRAPSKWGICDMYGNVWEWCQDWMDTYEPADVVNPKGPAIGMFKVVRGGSWQNELDMCRASYRTSVARPESKPNIGFRVVLAPE